MGEEQKRLLIAFSLIIFILLLWSFLSPPAPQQRKIEPQVADTLPLPVSSREEKLPSGDTIVIDRQQIKIVFSTSGGSVRSFYLKNYDIDIVPAEKALFTTIASDSLLSFDYEVYSDSLVFKNTIRGKIFTKKYYFDQEYGFTLRIEFEDTIGHILSLKSGMAITEKKNEKDDLNHFGVYIKNEGFKTITKNITEKFEYNKKWEWLALRNKYFVLIVNNHGDIAKTNLYKLSNVPLDKEIEEGYLGCDMVQNTHRFGAEIHPIEPLNISVLLLPIQYYNLAKYKRGYEQIASGGMWGPIARAILVVLKFFYSGLKNYGFVIVIFSLLLKLVFFPLSRQMLISQQRMQLLQPELKKIQEKYKNDPQALNREMMHLYKVYKVNPFSGCLPLLIQFPIFIALYQVLSTAIEFRQAPFILWITDLSLKDPYYVLPIGMGVMMLIQSLLTVIDPRQKFMVIMMPLVMVFVFLNFPSGLQLYWFTYNILSFVEQFLIKKNFFKVSHKKIL